MPSDEDRGLPRFTGRSPDDYDLWQKRVFIALKGRKLWNKINDEKCDQGTKEEAAAILVAALGDAVFLVCSSKVDDRIEVLEALDKRYASHRACNRIPVLTSLLMKKYQNGQDISKFIDEFESLFDQFDKMVEGASSYNNFRYYVQTLINCRRA